MSIKATAHDLAGKGFWLFPVAPDSKIPVKGMQFKTESSCEPSKIDQLFENENVNIGIYAGKFKEDKSLIIVDFDVQKGAYQTRANLMFIDGKEFPKTLKQKTPSGGFHLFYYSDEPVSQGPAEVLGTGIDVRADGGYVVGPGSRFNSKTYELDTSESSEPQKAPEWLVEFLKNRRPERRIIEGDVVVDQALAEQRATQYLLHSAPVAVQGQSGDSTTFKVAAHLKDLGVDEIKAWQLMLEHWNPRSVPTWDSETLRIKVQNAYLYGQNSFGADSPEAQFKPVSTETPKTVSEKGPIEKLNDEYFFALAGTGHLIVRETTNHLGERQLQYMKDVTFHAKHESWTMTINRDSKIKQVPVTKEWMRSPKRRTYDGIVFAPGRKIDNRFYNLWRGFSYDPAPEGIKGEEHESVRSFLGHIKENICGNNPELFRWFVGYFAHLIQKPFERPGTALVLRGKKGVGKSFPIEQFMALIKHHKQQISNPKHFTGNFNAHLENCLLLCFEEAFFSGDKVVDSILKHSITGRTRVIERKGVDVYEVENLCRNVIIGNENWLVPASNDERRYAVFNVGTGNMNNRAFFKKIEEGFVNGGYAYLLRYLLDFDISDLDFGEAPKTEGLLEQKIESLDYLGKFWYESLEEGKIANSTQEAWPEKISKQEVRESLYRFLVERNITKTYRPGERQIFRRLKEMCEFIRGDVKTSSGGGGPRVNAYQLPSLKVARASYDKFLGQNVPWTVVDGISS